jgi:hypothetical protein
VRAFYHRLDLIESFCDKYDNLLADVIAQPKDMLDYFNIKSSSFSAAASSAGGGAGAGTGGATAASAANTADVVSGADVVLHTYHMVVDLDGAYE